MPALLSPCHGTGPQCCAAALGSEWQCLPSVCPFISPALPAGPPPSSGIVGSWEEEAELRRALPSRNAGSLSWGPWLWGKLIQRGESGGAFLSWGGRWPPPLSLAVCLKLHLLSPLTPLAAPHSADLSTNAVIVPWEGQVSLRGHAFLWRARPCCLPPHSKPLLLLRSTI